MDVFLLKVAVYPLIIILGYLLKRIGLFQPTDYRIVSKIVLNITVPAAVITGFASLQMKNELILVVLLGLFCNLVMIAFGFLISRHKSKPDRALFMLNMPGYNIGTATIPLIQSFLGPYGVAIASLFDIGNALMSTGGSYALTSRANKESEGQNPAEILKILRTSVPFITCISMLVFTLLQIRIPAAVVTFISPIASANAFLAMMMIGMMFEINLQRGMLKKPVIILGIRFLSAIVFSLLFYNLTPFSLEIRQILVIVVFSPISTLAPLFTDRSKGDGALSCLVSSLSIVISLISMTALMLFFS
jgi:predicted permease